MIGDNLSEFMGKTVQDFTAGEPADTASTVYRIRTNWDADSPWTTQFAAFLDEVDASKVEAFVVGAWHGDNSQLNSSNVIEALAAARDLLPNLKAIFLGDITSEENEISWIQQTDVSPLLIAYPKLEYLAIRGGEGLSIGDLRHSSLKTLIIQSGGLPASVVHEVGQADLPNLEHLELWLGEPNYGGDATAEDFALILRGDRFPKLKYLGLKDSVIQDEIASVVALAPIVKRLEVLDLSMGTLSDEGAQALLASPMIAKLRRLDLHHHYLSDAMIEKLFGLCVEVDLSDRQEPDNWNGQEHRYIAVSE